MLRKTFVAALLAVVCALPAAAQQPLRIEMRDGRITLRAQNVPLRTILSEWARVGGTRFINVERVTGAPVTIDLANVTERQALDVLLRNVAGYVLGARQAASPGISAIDRVVILATSTAPPRAPQPTFANQNPRIPQGFPQPGNVILQPQPQFDPNDGPDDDPPVNDPRRRQARPALPPNVAPDGELGVPVDSDDREPPDDANGVVTTPSNPFGVPAGSSAQPGVVTPVPTAPLAQPNQPSSPPVPDRD